MHPPRRKSKKEIFELCFGASTWRLLTIHRVENTYIFVCNELVHSVERQGFIGATETWFRLSVRYLSSDVLVKIEEPERVRINYKALDHFRALLKEQDPVIQRNILIDKIND